MNRLLALLSLTVIATLPTFSQVVNARLKDRYHTIAVAKFDVQSDVSISPQRLASLQDPIILELQTSKKAGEIIHTGDKAPHPDAPLLQLNGTVLKFKPGNQAERYFIGFGAGSTEIFADISLSDATSGQVFMTEELRGIIATWMAPSSAADHMLAKRVSTATQLMLDAELPRTDHANAAPVEGPPVPAEQYSLPLASGDLMTGEEQMNAEAAAGYRVVGAVVTGRHTAEVKFEKMPPSAQTYEYRLFHIMLEGTMKKDLREAEQTGFCLRAHTLMPQFGGVISWVMERQKGMATPRCEYREHMTLRTASAESDVEKGKKDGFHLADTTEITAGHIVLMERMLGVSAPQ